MDKAVHCVSFLAKDKRISMADILTQGVKPPRLPIRQDSGCVRRLLPLQLRDSAGFAPDFPDKEII
ncbi:protein of unknown function [Nitrospina watsonii]|uniref:Uncharacterized protein n=1 Tax=Nitrospina watsonii TaxID=1323948 RepID=A0ABM9HH39_9BACT|nr:protein of unknown function [Nitrospina watsonii]